MRRIFAMLLALTMVLAMTACGAKEEAAPAQTTAAIVPWGPQDFSQHDGASPPLPPGSWGLSELSLLSCRVLKSRG